MMTHLMYGALALLILVSGWAGYLILTPPKPPRRKNILPDLDRSWKDQPDTIKHTSSITEPGVDTTTTTLNLNQLWNNKSPQSTELN